jgi:hypothetical protein
MTKVVTWLIIYLQKISPKFVRSRSYLLERINFTADLIFIFKFKNPPGPTCERPSPLSLLDRPTLISHISLISRPRMSAQSCVTAPHYHLVPRVSKELPSCTFICESTQFLASLYSSRPTSDLSNHPAAGCVAYQAGQPAEVRLVGLFSFIKFWIYLDFV